MRVSPWAAKTVGTGRSSTVWATRSSRVQRSAPRRPARALGDVAEEGDVDPAGDDLAACLDEHGPRPVALRRVGQGHEFAGDVLQCR